VVHGFRVAKVDYFSDSPNKPLEPENPADKALTRLIVDLLGGARREIVLQTPYLVISRPARRVFRDLRERVPDLRVIVSTNSLAATDAFYVYALSHKYKKRYIKHLGFEIHEFKPFPGDAPQMIQDYVALGGARANPPQGDFTPAPVGENHGPRIGLHAKSIVIDGRISLIGSHNFDPRSDNYNTESGFIIHDEPFAQALRASVLRDTEPQNAWVIARRPRPLLVERVNNAINDFSTALPLFDFWPFRYATSFELKPGCEPLRTNDPRFYECYEAVGDFPGVNLPLKSIYTRIVTAFGAGLVGIL
ncbi:MAG TPA: phospholipase D-like domain-containing protein, partial [Tahibacter sp.]|uniref:phospholipase D-like domain-containing protein n=1 Tax=Tahibacter sp. TaxID=2056211 RepID=UPI002C1F95B4